MLGKPPFLRYTLWRWTALGVVTATTISGCLVYKLRRHENARRKKFENFFRNYDAYQHMKEICSHSPGIMHSCPKDLAIAYEKRGLKG